MDDSSSSNSQQQEMGRNNQAAIDYGAICNMMQSALQVLETTIHDAIQTGLLQKIIEENDVARGNAFIDDVLKKIITNPAIASELDPLVIQNINEPHLQTTEVKVTGLSTLHRKGDILSSIQKDGATVISGVISAEDLVVKFKYWVKAAIFWINGDGKIKVDRLSVMIEVSTKDGNTELINLKVKELGDFTVEEINGLSFLFNWLLKFIARKMILNSKTKITVGVESEAAKAFRDLFQNNKLYIRES